MTFIIISLIAALLGLLAIIFKRERFEEGYVVFGVMFLLCGLLAFIISIIEYSQKENYFNRWKEDRNYVEVALMSIDKVKNNDQLLIIYENVKESNDNLKSHIESINNNDIFSDYHDERFLNYEPIVITKNDDKSHTIKSSIRQEKLKD